MKLIENERSGRKERRKWKVEQKKQETEYGMRTIDSTGTPLFIYYTSSRLFSHQFRDILIQRTLRSSTPVLQVPEYLRRLTCWGSGGCMRRMKDGT
jgi:hypothetical protein